MAAPTATRRPAPALLQPALAMPNFLALAYALSARETSMRTVRVGLDVLDEIARLKTSDALLCDAGNWRISQRFMRRWGWEPHCPTAWWHRHFIKRFYGAYPRRPAWLASAEPRHEPDVGWDKLASERRPTMIEDDRSNGGPASRPCCARCPLACPTYLGRSRDTTQRTGGRSTTSRPRQPIRTTINIQPREKQVYFKPSK